MNEIVIQSVRRMAERICEILAENAPSVYLYGSVVADDFHPGWSDIDILVLTPAPISDEQAEQLLNLRQTEADIPYARAFEGGMLPLEAFLTGAVDRVIYWGTGGERIAQKYHFDSFCRAQLLADGMLICGKEVRPLISAPTREQLRQDIVYHLDAIRRYAQITGRDLYAFGWMLDIARCIYTLRTGRIIAKTAAAEWAVARGMDSDALRLALQVRLDPISALADPEIMACAEGMGPHVQAFADVLERELNR